MKKTLITIIFLFSGLIYISSSQIISNLPIPICTGTAEVINDSIYFFGGANRWAGTILYQTVYKFDGASWSYHDSIPDDNVWGMESVVVGNDIYLFAGWPSGGRFVRKYDAKNRSWQYLNQGPSTTPYGISVEYLNNHIYLFNTTGAVYEYNLGNDTWQTKTPNSTPGHALSSVIYQDEVYVIGFYDTTFYKYNPIADEWTQLANTPYKISRCAMEVINNKIYCVGGSPEGNVAPVRTLLGYDILSDTWSIDQFQMMDERAWMADLMYNNQFIVLGGFDSTGFAVDIVEEIIPIGPVTDIFEQLRQPAKYILSQNYPNPFNPSTVISWQSPVGSHQTLKIYDLLGNEVASLVDEYKPAGTYEVEFDGSELKSGIYFYTLTAGSFIQTMKMILLK